MLVNVEKGFGFEMCLGCNFIVMSKWLCVEGERERVRWFLGFVLSDRCY